MGRALVTSARTRVAYNICKSLARRGIEVVVADTSPHAMTFHSRHAAGTARYTSPFRDEECFVADIERIIRRERIDVLIPVLEETYMVARHQERLAASAGLLLADYQSILRLHDKQSLRLLAANCGVAMPATLTLDEVARDDTAAHGLPYPVVVKPKQGGGGWAIRDAASPEALQAVVQELRADLSRYLVQQRVQGDTVCVAMLYDDGKPVARDAYRTLATYPAPYGQATLRESVRCTQAEDGLKALLDASAWKGVCEADFIVDAATGQAFLIDVNPRFWGSLVQSIACGVDFPYLYYKLALGEHDFDPQGARSHAVTRWLGGDALRFATNLRTADGKLAFLRDSFRSRLRSRMFDDFEVRDPLPLLAWCGEHVWRRLRPERGDGNKDDALSGVWE